MRNLNSIRKISLIAGIGYLVIFVSGIFANFFVLEGFITLENAEATYENIGNNLPLFRLGIAAFVIMVVFDLLLTWALYYLFNSINEKLSMFATWFRLVNCAIFGIAVFNLFDVVWLVNRSANDEYVISEVMRSLNSFNYTWLIGLIFFGIHLLALGYIIIKSKAVPRFIGVLLIIAGAGYLTDSFAHFMMSNYDEYRDVFSMMVVLPGIIGELSFTIWLLLKGGRTSVQERKCRELNLAIAE